MSMLKRLALILTVTGMVLVTGMETPTEAASPRAAFRQGYRVGVRTATRGFVRVGRAPVRVRATPRGGVVRVGRPVVGPRVRFRF
jgi:hypothetical protein